MNRCHLSLRLISSVTERLNAPAAKLQSLTPPKNFQGRGFFSLAAPLLLKLTIKSYFEAFFFFFEEMILQLGLGAQSHFQKLSTWSKRLTAAECVGLQILFKLNRIENMATYLLINKPCAWVLPSDIKRHILLR